MNPEIDFTKIIDNEVHFNIHSFGEYDPTNLVEYVNQECKKCNVTVKIDNPPTCECPTARLYYAMTKLAVTEDENRKLKESLRKTKESLKKINLYAKGIFHDANERDKVKMQANSIKHEIVKWLSGKDDDNEH